MKVDHTSWYEPENKAAQCLADVLEEMGNKKLTKKVGKYINKFHQRAKALNTMDNGTKMFYYQFLVKNTKADVRKYFFQHELVVTLLESLITAIYRDELRKMNII